MATNLLAPNGLQPGRPVIGGAPTQQANPYQITVGYGSNIGRGDLVKTGTGANQGNIILAALADTAALGVFQGVLPYYDQTLQATSHGLNGSYQSGANPLAAIPCLVYVDPFVTFVAQVSGGPYLASWRGQNINFLAGTNGAPNISGISTLALDGASVANTNTLPLRIVGLASASPTGQQQDATTINPWLEVRLNTSEILTPQGI